MFYGWADRPMSNCFEKFQVSSFKFVGRASVPANVGCVPRTVNICHFS